MTWSRLLSKLLSKGLESKYFGLVDHYSLYHQYSAQLLLCGVKQMDNGPDVYRKSQNIVTRCDGAHLLLLLLRRLKEEGCLGCGV